MIDIAKIVSILVITLSLVGCASIMPSEAVQLARVQADIAKYDRDARIAEARMTTLEFTTISCGKPEGEPCIFRAPAGSYDAKGRVKYGFLDNALDGVISFGVVSRVLDKIN